MYIVCKILHDVLYKTSKAGGVIPKHEVVSFNAFTARSKVNDNKNSGRNESQSIAEMR